MRYILALGVFAALGFVLSVVYFINLDNGTQTAGQFEDKTAATAVAAEQQTKTSTHLEGGALIVRPN